MRHAKRATIFLSLLVLCGVLVPLFALAHSPGIPYWGSPLLSCGAPGAEKATCTSICDLLHTGQHIIYLGLTVLLFAIVPIMVAIGGLTIILGTSSTIGEGASAKQVSRGKGIIKNAIVGAAIGLGAFLIVNTVLWGLHITTDPTGREGFAWPTIQCEAKEPATFAAPAQPSAPGGGPLLSGLPPSCRDPAQLAAKYGAIYPKQISQELQTLIACVRNSSAWSSIDGTQVYTWERSNELCNYTKGNSICGKCAHRVNSCHYGGISSNRAALAVDFNAQNSSARGERDLFLELDKIRSDCRFGSIIFEGDHTHVTTQSCAEGGD